MEAQEIYNLLDNGWVYCDYSDLYFENAFFSHIPKKYVMRIDGSTFIKKSRKLYSILKNWGADMDRYDSIVMIYLHRDKNMRKIVDVYSLRRSEILKEIAERIAGKSKSEYSNTS